MAKYVIEVEEKISCNNGVLYRIKGFDSLVFTPLGLSKLIPIDEAIKEAYEEGYEDGKKDASQKPISVGDVLTHDGVNYCVTEVDPQKRMYGLDQLSFHVGG